MTVQDDMDQFQRDVRELWLKVAAALRIAQLAAWLSRKLERKP